MAADSFREILKKYWGYDDFRGIQRQIVESISSGRDTLGLMPTGGGKSVCFQVPALAKEGITLVVTPLISLMKDQVRQLKDRGIKAEAVYSGMTRNDIVRTLDNCVFGAYTFLYISPERLSSPLFLAKLERMTDKISYLVIDEAHCISQWGYDFRPSYLCISEIRKLLPNVPVLALTATAPPKVVEDIQERLAFRQKNVISMSFERKNLVYVVRKSHDKLDEIVHILSSVKEGSAIVYVRTRAFTSEIARFLNDAGISALAYHAGLTTAEKDFRQANWTSNQVRVMVATNAFGMGIDKPDVRMVIHYSMPDSIEAYFQEAGRAGRDGKLSYAVLLFQPSDMNVISRREDEAYPTPEYIRKTYENVAYFLQVGIGEAEGRSFFFPMETFCRMFKQFPVQANSALKILNNAGYIEYHEEHEFQSAIHFIVTKADMYRINETDANTENVIQFLFRNYTGLFADFVYIEETLIARSTGLDNDTVYKILKNLHSRRIIDYIPRRVTPTITYTVPRVETERIQLFPQVYQNRKDDYHKRIQYVIQYASSTSHCRSRMLLYYFGEKDATDCGRCDVCLEKKRNPSETQDKVKLATNAIVKHLSDGQRHEVSELYHLVECLPKVVDSVVRRLISEEIVSVEGTYVVLKQ